MQMQLQYCRHPEALPGVQAEPAIQALLFACCVDSLIQGVEGQCTQGDGGSPTALDACICGQPEIRNLRQIQNSEGKFKRTK